MTKCRKRMVCCCFMLLLIVCSFLSLSLSLSQHSQHTRHPRLLDLAPRTPLKGIRRIRIQPGEHQYIPTRSMCAIYAYIDPPNHPNVGKYGIHGAFGIYISKHFRRSPQDFLTPCPAPQEESDIITESTSQKYFADFHALLTKPSCREVAAAWRRTATTHPTRPGGCRPAAEVQGPRRDNKAEAIKECQTAPVRSIHKPKGMVAKQIVSEKVFGVGLEGPNTVPSEEVRLEPWERHVCSSS